MTTLTFYPLKFQIKKPVKWILLTSWQYHCSQNYQNLILCLSEAKPKLHVIKFWRHFENLKTLSYLQWPTPQPFLDNLVGQTYIKSSFTTFCKKYYAACRPSLQDFLEKVMAAITTSWNSCLDFQKDVKILFSEWPTVLKKLLVLLWFKTKYVNRLILFYIICDPAASQYESSKYRQIPSGQIQNSSKSRNHCVRYSHRSSSAVRYKSRLLEAWLRNSLHTCSIESLQFLIM